MRRIETIIVILALGFYVWFLSYFGIGQVLHFLHLAGWGLAVTVSLESIAKIANTMGWWVTIGERRRDLTFTEVFVARIAGEAVDYVTPTAQLGGQFVMALIVRRNLEMAAGLATVIIAALTEMVGQISFVTIALMLSIRLVPMATGLFWTIASGFAIVLTLIAVFFYFQRSRPFSFLLGAASKIPGVDAAEYREAAGEADAILLDFYAHHRGRLLLSCVCYLFAWSLGPLELYILLRLLRQPVSFDVVLLLEAAGLLIERATFMIPAKLVSQEGGKALILSLMGYPASAGFAVGFLRRVKEMIWVLIGLLTLTIHRMMIGTDEGGAGSSVNLFGVRKIPGEESL